MFKFAQLVAVAAASTAASTASTASATASADEKKAMASVNAASAKVKKNLTTSGSKIGTLFTMQGATGAHPPTYNGLAANHVFNSNLANVSVEQCVQCTMAGGDWGWTVTTPASAATAGVAKTATHAAIPAHAKVDEVLSTTTQTCTFTGASLTKSKLASTTAKPNHATVDPNLEYGDMFKGFGDCHSWGKVTKEVQLDSYSATTAVGHLQPVSRVRNFTTTFVGINFNKKAITAASDWEVVWAPQTSGKAPWAAGRVVLPHDYAGGMFMSVANDADTHFAMRIDATIPRYFNAASAQAQSIGKTGKVSIVEADAIEFMIQGTSTWTAAANTKKPFKISFSRASYVDIAKFAAEHGGSTMWIIIGVVVVVLCCVTGCIYHYCKNKNKDSEDENFYQVEDCYARI